jgi:hypothetical protein
LLTPTTRAAFIGIAVAFSIVVFVLAVLIVLYVRRERRRRSMPSSNDEKPIDLPPCPPPKSLLMDNIDGSSTMNKDTLPVTAKVIPRSRRQGLLLSRRFTNIVGRSWLDMGNRDSRPPSRKREAKNRESLRSIDIDRVLDVPVIFDDGKSFDTASFRSEGKAGDQTPIAASSLRHAREPPDVPTSVSAQRGYRTFRRYLQPPSLISNGNPNVTAPLNSGVDQSHHSIGAITLPLFNVTDDNQSLMSEVPVIKPDSPTRGRRSFSSIAATLASSIEVPPPVVVNGCPFAY